MRQDYGNFAPARKPVRTTNHTNIEAATFQEKAKEYATELGIDDFQFSDGWLHGFNRRYDIQFRVISGESGDVRAEQTDEWTTIALPQLLRDYNPRDILNADESELFKENFCQTNRLRSKAIRATVGKDQRTTDNFPLCKHDWH